MELEACFGWWMCPAVLCWWQVDSLRHMGDAAGAQLAAAQAQVQQLKQEKEEQELLVQQLEVGGASRARDVCLNYIVI
jgi:cell division protein FtsB